MQRGNGSRDDFFGSGSPFGGFGDFGRPGSLMSSFFGGRDPFDDPFFNQPFGSLMGPSMFGPARPGMFGSGGWSPFGERNNHRFVEQHEARIQSKGPVIEELSSDDDEGGTREGEERQPQKITFVEDPDEETEEKKSEHTQFKRDLRRDNVSEPQTQTYGFKSSTVTYGGINGAYYTSSTTRRTGGDGVTVEESKEADTTTKKATHRISRGIHDKGHSVTRKLNSDGKVETVQTLHNLNEDELTGFEAAWEGNARQHLPVWNQGLNVRDNSDIVMGNNNNREGKWALPSTEQAQSSGRRGTRSVPIFFKGED